MIEKIVSGGQTGVDRAALDAAIYMSIPYGGCCPKGRIDELGIIPSKYSNLIAITGNFNTEKENYVASTKANIKDSDGTLIVVPKLPFLKDSGTAFTITEASVQKKP